MKPRAWHGMLATSPSLHRSAIVVLFNAKFHNSIQHPLLGLFEFVCLLLAAPHHRPSISTDSRFVLFYFLLCCCCCCESIQCDCRRSFYPPKRRKREICATIFVSSASPFAVHRVLCIHSIANAFSKQELYAIIFLLFISISQICEISAISHRSDLPRFRQTLQLCVHENTTNNNQHARYDFPILSMPWMVCAVCKTGCHG